MKRLTNPLRNHKTRRRLTRLAAGSALLTLAVHPAYAQNQAPANDQPVTREEYNRLKSELEALKAQIQQQPQPQQQKPKADAKETEDALDDLQKQIKRVKDQADEVKPGISRLQMVGLAYANFSTSEKEGAAVRRNVFSTQISPTFLYRPYEPVLVEAEPEMKLNSGKHDVFGLELEQMHAAYLLNDYMTLDAGQMLNPDNVYAERLHQVWIEKTPSKALALANDTGAILPSEHLGFQIRGGAPVGPVQLDYAAFVANGPKLIVKPNDDQKDDGLTTGNLDFDSFANLGNSFAYGGHLGVLPIPGLEIGYGFEIDDAIPYNGDTDKVGGSTVRTLLQTVDLNYVLEAPALKGTLDWKAQWAWQHIGAANYADAGLGVFSVNRNGGYARIAYRPSKLKSFVRNFEPVFRYDAIRQINTPSGFNESRYTVGLDYWLSWNSALKFAYIFDRQDGVGKNADAITFQWAIGF